MDKITILQEKLSDKHQDSFWYEGLIAKTENYELRAVGDVEFLFNGEKYKDYHAFEFADDRGWNDTDLNKPEWLANNWFQIFDLNLKETIICDEQSFDNAIKELEKLEEQTNG